MSALNIAALILCAGESSRMGSPKGLLKWRGNTLIGHAVQSVKGVGIKNIVVALGAHFSEMNAMVDTLDVESVQNVNWNLGMGSTIKVGVSFIQNKFPELDGILIQLSDQPLVTSNALKKIISCHQENPEKIVAAQYYGSFGVPALFPQRFFPQLLEISDDSGAKKLICDNQNEVIGVPLHEGALDIDTPEQYQDLLNASGVP